MGDRRPYRGTNVPELAGLDVGDAPSRWEALGFAVQGGRQLELGGVRVTLGAEGRGITRWAIRGIEATKDIDGLPTAAATIHSKPVPHPNGATGIDHVVVVTPDFDRTGAALAEAGMGLRRIREVGNPGDPNAFRQGFRRLGPAILELVEAKTAPAGPARFWGLVVIVSDLDALKDRLADRLGSIRSAVQPGRRIATLHSHAQLGQKLAFMDPEG